MKPNLNSLLTVAIASALIVCAGHRAQSQTELDLPLASQAAQVKQRLGVTDITITYHRPMVNGRKIWGAVVRYDKVWRAGERIYHGRIQHASIRSGQPLPAGTYGLHMIPTADKWTIIFSKMAVAWGSYRRSE